MISYLTIQPLDRGSAFPEFSGKSFKNSDVVFPDCVKGKVSILFFTFMQEGKNQIDTWLSPLRAKYKNNPELVHYCISMVRKYNKVHALFLNVGLKWLIPKKYRNSQHVFYAGKLEKFYCYFNVSSLSDCCLYVLDRNGKVQFVNSGEANNEKLQDFFQVLQKLTVPTKEQYMAEH